MKRLRSLLLSLALLGAPAARAETVLHIGDQKGNTRAVMEAADVLADAPYRIEWAEFAAAAPLLEAAKVGAIDAGWCGDAPFTFATASGAPIKAILATRSGQEQLAIVVRGDSPAKNFKDLAGKRIATGRGSIGHQLVLALLEKNGLKPGDIDLVFMPPADAGAALQSGSIDAWSTWDPYTARLEIVDRSRRVADGVGTTPGLSFLFARDDAAADPAKRAALADFVTRYARARAWGLRNAESYGRTWAKLVGLPEAVGIKVVVRDHVTATPLDAGVVADEQKTIDLYVRNGLIATKLEAAKLVDPSFTGAIAAGAVD
jgi:sulfonate transport system substrate-binding protein